MIWSLNFQKYENFCLFTFHDLKVFISVVILGQKHFLVVFQSFEKNDFLEFKVNLA